jgi:hypothetical protein
VSQLHFRSLVVGWLAVEATVIRKGEKGRMLSMFCSNESGCRLVVESYEGLTRRQT